MQTRDQQYAISAHEKVTKIKGQKGDKGYGSMSHKLPILIRTAGLAQALTFVEARFKDKDLRSQLLIDLAQTIALDSQNGIDKHTLPAEARKAELSDYMRLTQQVLDALLWYKRFAQSILGVEAGDDVEEETGNDNH